MRLQERAQSALLAVRQRRQAAKGRARLALALRALLRPANALRLLLLRPAPPARAPDSQPDGGLMLAPVPAAHATGGGSRLHVLLRCQALGERRRGAGGRHVTWPREVPGSMGAAGRALPQVRAGGAGREGRPRACARLRSAVSRRWRSRAACFSALSCARSSAVLAGARGRAAPRSAPRASAPPRAPGSSCAQPAGWGHGPAGRLRGWACLRARHATA